MRIGEEIQRREKKQRIAQIYTDISYYAQIFFKNRHLTGVRETSKTKFTPKRNTKQCEKKNQALYTRSLNSTESFSTEKLSK